MCAGTYTGDSRATTHPKAVRSAMMTWPKIQTHVKVKCSPVTFSKEFQNIHSDFFKFQIHQQIHRNWIMPVFLVKNFGNYFCYKTILIIVSYFDAFDSKIASRCSIENATHL